MHLRGQFWYRSRHCATEVATFLTLKAPKPLKKNRNKISTIKKAMKISENKTIINSGVPHFPQCISHPTKYQETMRNFVKKCKN